MNKEKAGFANWCKTYTGQKYITSVLFLLIPVILLVTFTFVPAFNLIPYSFQERGMLTTADKVKSVGLDNYRTIFSDESYLETFKVSLYYLVGSFFQQAVALLMATILCSSIRFKNFFKGVVFFPYLMNGVAVSIIFSKFFGFDLFNQGGLNSIFEGMGIDPVNWLSGSPVLANWVLVFVSIWRYIGYDILMYIGAIQSISPDLYEAADLDGANPWERFIYIVFPSIKPIISLQLILAVKGAISVFEIPLIMTNGTNHTGTFVMLTVSEMFNKDHMGLASAMAIVVLIITIIVTIIQKLAFREDEGRGRRSKRK